MASALLFLDWPCGAVLRSWSRASVLSCSLNQMDYCRTLTVNMQRVPIKGRLTLASPVSIQPDYRRLSL